MPVTGKSTRSISPARAVSFAVLEAVLEGAYASDLLRQESLHLTSRDARLASQIAFGCLRFQAQLDYLIETLSGRAAAKLDRAVLIALRAGIFQLRYLERIPPHAAVDESVEYVKRTHRSAAGFVNAVLRKVDRRPVEWPDRATELSCPAWLLERWSRHFGPEAARGIALAFLEEPAAYIRIPAGAPRPELALEPTVVPGAYRLTSPAPPGARLHDISSQTVIPQLALEPGMSYLDLCAAPGNKTVQALETPLRLAIACDISPKRIREIPPVCPRVLLDATLNLPFGISFDRVFIDAPCSGTGTIARNPEIKWRLTPADLARFAEKQASILTRALRVLARGGKLLYATCSLEPEENENVIQSVGSEDAGVIVQSQIWRIPGRDEGDGFYNALLSRS